MMVVKYSERSGEQAEDRTKQNENVPEKVYKNGKQQIDKPKLVELLGSKEHNELLPNRHIYCTMCMMDTDYCRIEFCGRRQSCQD